LGAAYHQMGDYQKARAYYLQALKIDPGNQTIFINLGKLAMDTRIQQLSASAIAHPSAQAYLRLGQAQQAAAHLPEARESYEPALKLDPKLSDAKIALDGLSNQTRR
jgi:tetratricopeptide (TPR) repeat protein